MKGSKEQLIHEAAMHILNTVGVQIHNEKACQIFRDHNIRMEANVAFFSEDQVWEWVHKAPENFTIYGRNPQHDVFVGGGITNTVPTYGCAFIDDWDGNRRPGKLEDVIRCLKLVQAEDVYDINGGIIVQPGDIPQETASVAMFYANILTSDKVILLPTGFKKEMEIMMKACSCMFGGKEKIIEKPRTIALINTVSPLQLDERMLDCLMVLAEYGQPVILCPASMLAATSPWSMAGTLASNTAENLAGIILSQMIRPGTPAVFGIQSTAADMRGGITFACAAPEGAMMQGYAPNMAKFYGLPSRGGGCQTDAPRINCQAGYESMLTYYSAENHGINIVMEAGGVMDSVNATSFEKMIVDFEIIRQVKFMHTPFVIDEETIDLEEIEEIGHSGSYVAAESTLDHFQDIYIPKIGSRNAGLDDEDYFRASIMKEMERLFKKYDKERPILKMEVKKKVREILETSGLDPIYFDHMEELVDRREW